MTVPSATARPSTTGSASRGNVLNRFAYHRAESPEDVSALLSEFGPDARVLAGGTDLVVQMRAGATRPAHVVDITRIDALRAIDETADGAIRVGANVTMTRLRRDGTVRSRFPALVEGAAEVGSIQIQNRATLVGNLCNASPAADSVPALAIYDATANVWGSDGPRQVPVRDFASGPRSTVLRGGEWVHSVEIDHREGSDRSAYVKLGRTPGVDLAIVGVACGIFEDEVRLAFASVGPTVATSPTAERILTTVMRDGRTDFPSEAERAIDEEVSPIDDVRSSAAYRSAMVRVVARRAWSEANERRSNDA